MHTYTESLLCPSETYKKLYVNYISIKLGKSILRPSEGDEVHLLGISTRYQTKTFKNEIVYLPFPQKVPNWTSAYPDFQVKN